MTQVSYTRKTYDYLTQKWYISALLFTLSGHWFLILRYVGHDIGLVNQNGQLTNIGNIFTWPLFLISLFFAFAKTWADKYNDDIKNNGQRVLDKLLQCVDSVTNKKTTRFIEFINNSNNKQAKSVLGKITRPRDQIGSLIENIQTLLSELFGINRGDIGLSLIYKFDNNSQWTWLKASHGTLFLKANDLVKNSSSTVYKIINDKKKTSIFFPDKKIAAQNGQYLVSQKDDTYDGIGSIICRKLCIGNDNNGYFAEAILTLNTYGKQLCKHGDKLAMNKIENMLLPVFVKRFELELAQLYVNEMLYPKCLDCPCEDLFEEA